MLGLERVEVWLQGPGRPSHHGHSTSAWAQLAEGKRRSIVWKSVQYPMANQSPSGSAWHAVKALLDSATPAVAFVAVTNTNLQLAAGRHRRPR